MIEGAYPQKEYRVYRNQNGKYLAQWHDLVYDIWYDIKRRLWNGHYTDEYSTAERAETACHDYANKDKQEWTKRQLAWAQTGVIKELGKLP